MCRSLGISDLRGKLDLVWYYADPADGVPGGREPGVVSRPSSTGVGGEESGCDRDVARAESGRRGGGRAGGGLGADPEPLATGRLRARGVGPARAGAGPALRGRCVG